MGSLSGNYQQANVNSNTDTVDHTTSNTSTYDTTAGSTSQDQIADSGSYTDPWGAQGDNVQAAWGQAWNTYANANNLNTSTSQDITNYKDYLTNSLNARNRELSTIPNEWNAALDREQRDYTKWKGYINQLVGNLGTADEYAADFAGKNPYLDQSVDSMWNNVERVLAENIYGAGGVDHQAQISGNMSSSRAGVAEGNARADAARTGQEAELGLRSDAYTQGLNQWATDQDILYNTAGQLLSGKGDRSDLLRGKADSMTAVNNAINDTYSSIINLDSLNSSNNWNSINNLWNILGSNSWGASTSNWGDTSNTGTTLNNGLSNATGISTGTGTSDTSTHGTTWGAKGEVGFGI
jgi:hypothetical protein